MQTEAKEPVFPTGILNQSGLNKREFFAILALHAIIGEQDGEPSFTDAAIRAVYTADALMAALNRSEP